MYFEKNINNARNFAYASQVTMTFCPICGSNHLSLPVTKPYNQHKLRKQCVLSWLTEAKIHET